MNSIEEKIDKAAREYAIENSGTQDDWDDYGFDVNAISDMLYQAHLNGAENLLSLPLVERLTDEEKKKIKEIYEKTESDHCHVDEYNDWAVDNMLERLEALFGLDFLNEKGE